MELRARRRGRPTRQAQADRLISQAPVPLSSALNDLTRRMSRKLMIKRGMALTYLELSLLVTSGAFAALQAATAKELEEQCRAHLQPPEESAP